MFISITISTWLVLATWSAFGKAFKVSKLSRKECYDQKVMLNIDSAQENLIM